LIISLVAQVVGRMNPDERREQTVDTTIAEAKVGDTVTRLTKHYQGDVQYSTRVEEGGELRGAPRSYTSFESALRLFLSGIRDRAIELEQNTP
jgi:hypothetical protein